MKVSPLLMTNVPGITAACRKKNSKELNFQREGMKSGITSRAAPSTDSGTFRILSLFVKPETQNYSSVLWVRSEVSLCAFIKHLNFSSGGTAIAQCFIKTTDKGCCKVTTNLHQGQYFKKTNSLISTVKIKKKNPLI